MGEGGHAAPRRARILDAAAIERKLALNTYNVDAARAHELLARSLTRTGIAGLDPVRQGRAHAVWHHFDNSPFNVVAVQAFAQWLHPQLFADLDPKALLATMQQRFQPVSLDGTYWTSLR